MLESSATQVQIGPILREAMASRGEGEDLDEAVLRVLKGQGHANAATLLGALSNLLDIEAKLAGETREQVVARLASGEGGPHLSLGNPVIRTTVRKSFTIRAGGKEYHSLEEVPPNLREAVEKALAGKDPEAKVSQTFPAGGKEYGSLQDMPPELRREVERAHAQEGKPRARMGCSMVMVLGAVAGVVLVVWR